MIVKKQTNKLIITQATDLSSDFAKSTYPVSKVAWSDVPSSIGSLVPSAKT
jgi:hypothetical protein